MIRGLYASASAMVADLLRQDVVANNIANATTPGYRRDCTGFESFPDMVVQAMGPVIGSITQGSRTAGTYVDMQKGAPHATGGTGDVFIRGDGYFVVQDGYETVYTRLGSFRVGSTGVLATQHGHTVLGVSGPIRVGAGQFTIDARGYVRSGDSIAGQLRVVRLGEHVQMTKNEHGYLVPTSSRSGTSFGEQVTWSSQPWPYAAGEPGGPYQVAVPDLETGSLELSNVNPVMEMVTLINVLRSYEANAKALSAQDETLSRAVNEIAR